MGQKVLLLVGTKKGGFILESDGDRREWRMREPVCVGWPVYHMLYDPNSRAVYAAGGSEWYGAAVWRSADLGESWSHSSEGLSYGEGEPTIKTVWSLAPADGNGTGKPALYAGVEPAGLFRSEDCGASWRHVDGLRDHPSRPNWQAGGGGLCLHSIVAHPSDPKQVWVGISSVGTFHTGDGGTTWTPRNKNVRADFMPERYPEVGQCVHHLLMAPGRPERLYQQNHCGVYRSSDGGASWDEITPGLPSQFGFPMAAHPRDPETVYVIPLDGDDQGRFMPKGKAAVWRSRDGGSHWERRDAGLPQEGAYFGVLRQAMAVDPLDRAGVYFGTSGGHLFGSADEGESWQEIATYLPPIWSVETAVIDA